MSITEARTYVGKLCHIRWHDRTGQERELLSAIYETAFKPLYGGYIVTDTDEIPLDQITHLSLIEQPAGWQRQAV